ncbi:Short-chain dehydrogenase/reductase 2b, partial [Nymphaea thermarum]
MYLRQPSNPEHSLRQEREQSGGARRWWQWLQERTEESVWRSEGIGLEVCRQLAEKGLTVIMTARKPQEQLSNLAQQFLLEAAETEGKNVIFHTLDITHWILLKIKINNAGVNNSVIDWGFVESNDDDKRAVM